MDLRRGEADLTYRSADAALIDLSLSPDGRRLIAGGELAVFDTHSGELVQRLEGHDPEAGEVGAIHAVHFTADGETLISAGDDRRIIHWSVPDWRIKHQWQAPNEVWSLALSPDGKLLASAGQGDGITIWSMADGKQIRTLIGESSTIAHGTGLAWLPYSRLISGSINGQIGIWDPATGEEQRLPTSHTDQVPAVAVSPDGEWIATGSGDHTIILWDANGRRLRRLRGHRNLVQGLATLRVFQCHTAGPWSVIVHDGRAYTAANDGTVRRWRLDRAGQWIWDQESASALLLPDPAGSRSGDLLIGFADGAIRGYKLPPVTAGHSDSGQAVARPVAATDAQDAPVAPSPNTAGDLRLDLPGAHDNWVLRFAVTPDGQMLATAGMDHTARIWHIRRTTDGLLLEPLRHFKQHSDTAHAVNFSSDGQLLATAGYDGQVGLFDPKTGDGQLSTRRLAVDQWPHYRRAVRLTPLGQPEPGRSPHRRRQTRGIEGCPLRSRPDRWRYRHRRRAVAIGRPRAKRLPRHLRFRRPPARHCQRRQDPPRLGWDLGPDAAPTATTGQVLFTLRLPELPQNPGPWDFDFRRDRDRAGCWIAVPLTVGRIALYRLPYARPPPISARKKRRITRILTNGFAQIRAIRSFLLVAGSR